MISLFCRVWDKVVSGSCKILVFVAVEILLTFKIKVMALNSAEKITKFLENVSALSPWVWNLETEAAVWQTRISYCVLLVQRNNIVYFYSTKGFIGGGLSWRPVL